MSGASISLKPEVYHAWRVLTTTGLAAFGLGRVCRTLGVDSVEDLIKLITSGEFSAEKLNLLDDNTREGDWVSTGKVINVFYVILA
eukprot:992419-Amorphochlora_amoeboformis.AAC.1